MSISDVLPCASKHGAMNSTTGPEPPGGAALGVATSCPQTVIVAGACGTAGAAAGCCARIGVAAMRRTSTDRNKRFGIKRLPADARVSETLTVLDLRRAGQRFGCGTRGSGRPAARLRAMEGEP